MAREAIEAALQRRPAAPAVEPVGALERRAPVFVTLRLDEALRGCMGSIEPRTPNLVDETMDRARAAAFTDPRFAPLALEELPRTTIEVTVVGTLESVESPARLDPRRFGIEVSDGAGRRAVLLPGIEGVETVEAQIAVTRKKAGLDADVEVAIRRFRAMTVSEPRS